MIGVIYLLTSPSGRQYIGQTTQTFNERMAKHKSASSDLEKTDGCRMLNNAIRKHGWDNFQKEIIRECPDFQSLNIAETELIQEYNTLAPNGYNLTLGGDSNLKSEVTKEKMRQSALARDSSSYRKSDSTKDLPKFVGEYESGYRISKHPRRPIKYFNTKPTKEENLVDALAFLQLLTDDPTLVVVPKRHDLEPGIQRSGNGFRVYYRNKKGIVITHLFTVKTMSTEQKYELAKACLQFHKNTDI